MQCTTYHLFEHDPPLNEGPGYVHAVGQVDIVISCAMHLQGQCSTPGRLCSITPSGQNMPHHTHFSLEVQITVRVPQGSWLLKV